MWDLAPYQRRRDMQGNRVANPFFDRVEDDLVLQALLFLEHCEDALHAHWQHCMAEEARSRS